MTDLLAPRYEVIADYPSNDFDIGQILTKSEMVEDWVCTDNFLHGFKLSAVLKFPHLFKPLAWYEKREVSEMPEYLKRGTNGTPRKVQEYFLNIGEFTEGGRWRRLSKGWIPATELEYLSYIKPKQ